MSRDEIRRIWRSVSEQSVITEEGLVICEAIAAELERQNAELERETQELRRLLAYSYCPPPYLYADDGELQDNRKFPIIDFKRDSAGMIATKMHRRGLDFFAATQPEQAIQGKQNADQA